MWVGRGQCNSVKEKEVVRAVQYAVGNTIVCDTLTEARKLCYGAERLKVSILLLLLLLLW